MKSERMSALEIAPGRWTEILASAGIDRNLLTRKESPCPTCGGKTRFTYYDRKEAKSSTKNYHGLSYCHHCGGRNGFQLLQQHLGLSNADTCRWIQEWYYGYAVEARPIAIAPSVSQDKLSAEEIAKNKEKHRRVWQEARPVTKGDPVWKYLCNRIPGFHEGMLSPVLRYHPSLPYLVYNEELKKVQVLGKFPAMIAFVTAPDGTCQDLHRTYLTSDGEKANVPNCKKTLASIEVFGGAIRLSQPTGNVLAVAEGIETAFAVELLKDLPTWSLLNTSYMMHFEVPSHIKFLHIFEDHDVANKFGVRAGTKAAVCLQERAEKQGIRVFRHKVAKVGFDFLNLVEGLQPTNQCV